MAEPTTRPPNDNPRDNKSSVYESLRVNGNSAEFSGGSVVQKAAIVARNNPACQIFAAAGEKGMNEQSRVNEKFTFIGGVFMLTTKLIWLILLSISSRIAGYKGESE